MPKKTIMVVDDESPINKAVKDILEPEGYRVITALSGQEALKKLKKEKPDLILIDMFMPSMSGLRLTKKIRENAKLKSIKIIYLTVLTFSKTQKQELKKLNIKGYIEKPFDNNEVIRKVNKIINK